MTRVRGARLLAVATIVPLLGAGLSACSDDSPSPSVSPTSTAVPSGPAGSPPPVDTATPSAATTTLPPRKVGQAAPLTEGVEVSVTTVSEKDLKASGPGEVAGAGVVVRLEVRNRTGKPFDLTSLAVNATYGKGTPAPPGDAEHAPGLSGSVKAGDTAVGTYAFSVPEDEADSLKVDVTSSASANVIIFRR